MDDLWNYIRQVRRPDPDNFFTTTWGGCLIRNVDKDGKLVSCSSREKYKNSKIPMWVYLKLTIFKSSQDSTPFPVYQCLTCDTMKAVGGMSLNQNPDEIQPLKCLHSQVCDEIVGADWMDTWELNLEEILDAGQSYSILLNEKEKYQTFRNEKDLFLEAVFVPRTRGSQFSTRSTQNRSFPSAVSAQNRNVPASRYWREGLMKKWCKC